MNFDGLSVFHQKKKKKKRAASCVTFGLVFMASEKITLPSIRTLPGFLRNLSHSHSRQQYTVPDTPLCVGEHVHVCGPALLACDRNGWVQYSVCTFFSSPDFPQQINSWSYQKRIQSCFPCSQQSEVAPVRC